MIKLSPFIFFVLFIVGCAVLKVEKNENLSRCHATMDLFFHSNFEDWRPLSGCTLRDISSYFSEWNTIPSRSYHAGSSHTNNVIKVFRRAENEQPKEIWYAADSSIFTKIVVEYPSVRDPKNLIRLLGVPDLKLDYYLDVLLYEKKEWVYLKEGLTLRLGDKNQVLWEIHLFVPTTKEFYLAQIHQTEQNRAFPYEK
jgi:hypothetical protein